MGGLSGTAPSPGTHPSPRTGALAGKVAVVTGASRGIGKGIALALGAEGATVYVTGRTVTAGSHPLPGTVGETAAEVGRRGGQGVAVQVDHADDAQVAALFAQVEREQGRLDILVNNAFSLPEDLTEPRPFWDKPMSNWDMVDVGVRSTKIIPSLRAERGSPIWFPIVEAPRGR
jgi:NAD(P)-dependent dehydrogenase (short-subunit alcohol dehydrogenase family)